MSNLPAASFVPTSSQNCFSGARSLRQPPTIGYRTFFLSVWCLGMGVNPVFGQGDPITTDSTNFFIRGFAFAFILWAFGFGLRLVRRLGSASTLSDV